LSSKGAEKRIAADLFHYSNPTITHYLQKIPYYSNLYLQRQLDAGQRWSSAAAIVRSLWRFVRAYVFRLGFLDGYPGFFIAFSTAYATLFRHTRLYEHQQPACPPCPRPRLSPDHQHLQPSDALAKTLAGVALQTRPGRSPPRR
jgi:hypothetical protein